MTAALPSLLKKNEAISPVVSRNRCFFFLWFWLSLAAILLLRSGIRRLATCVLRVSGFDSIYVGRMHVPVALNREFRFSAQSLPGAARHKPVFHLCFYAA